MTNTFAGHLTRIQPTDIVRGTTNANMHRPMPDGVPSRAPKKCKGVPILRQVSQHQQPYGDICPQVTPTNPFAGSGIPRQTDVQSTDSMEMA